MWDNWESLKKVIKYRDSVLQLLSKYLQFLTPFYKVKKMSCTSAGFCNFYRSVTARSFPFFFALNESYYGIYPVPNLSLHNGCIFQTTEKNSWTVWKRVQTTQRSRVFNRMQFKWIAFPITLLEEGVNVFPTWQEGQNEYLVTRKINTGRGWLPVHTLGSSSWAHTGIHHWL